MSTPSYPGPSDRPGDTGAQQVPPYPGPATPAPYPGPGTPPPYPGPAAAPPAYPGYPGYPGGYPANALPQQQRPKPPSTVTAAFGLYVLGAVLSVASMVMAVNSSVFDEIIRDAAGGAGVGGMSAASFISMTKTITIAVGVLFAALFLAFALVMYRGYNWARIVLTVLSALSVISAIGGVGGSSATYNGRSYQIEGAWMGWVTGICAAAGIVLMYLAASNRYFTAARIARKGR